MVKTHNSFVYVRWIFFGCMWLKAFDNVGQVLSFSIFVGSLPSSKLSIRGQSSTR